MRNKVKRFQIAGLPPWADLRGDLYDLDADAPGVPPTVEEVRRMLQAFLADRFQLRIHRESRVLPVYALVAVSKKSKLIPEQAPCLVIPGRAGGPATTLRKTDDSPMPWSFDVEVLAVQAGQPVIDQTGRTGSGYCTIDGVSPLTALLYELDSSASIFIAVEDAWGMKLEPKKAPVDVIVIDQVKRPSEN